MSDKLDNPAYWAGLERFMAPGQKTAAALERSERTGSFYPAPELVVDATKRAWAGAGQNEQNEGPRNRKKTSQTLRHKKGAWNAANADTEYAEQCANWAGDQDEGKRKEREERAMTREEKEFILDSAEKNPHLDMKELNRLLEDVMRPSLSQESIDDLMKDAHRVFRTNPADSNDEKADGSASDDSDNFQPRQAKQKQEGNFLGRAFNALRLNNATAAAKQPEKSPMLPKKAPKNPWKNIARLARAQAAADPGLEERALLDFQDGGDGIRPEDAMGEEEDVVNYDVGVFGAQPRMARVGQFEEEENSILEFLCTVDWMADQWGGHGTKLRFDRGGTGEMTAALGFQKEIIIGCQFTWSCHEPEKLEMEFELFYQNFRYPSPITSSPITITLTNEPLKPDGWWVNHYGADWNFENRSNRHWLKRAAFRPRTFNISLEQGRFPLYGKHNPQHQYNQHVRDTVQNPPPPSFGPSIDPTFWARMVFDVSPFPEIEHWRRGMRGIRGTVEEQGETWRGRWDGVRVFLGYAMERSDESGACPIL